MGLRPAGMTVTALVLVAACGGGGTTNPPNPPPSAVTINLDGSAAGAFSPVVDTLAVGGTVTWQWDQFTHDVTSFGDPGFIDIPSHTGVQAPQTIFPNPGTYKFVCLSHGTNPTPATCSGMCGTLVVK
ncbi:MAG: hypothetical protein ABJC74_11670 [Gemmatimonadota bacterium]